MGTFLELLIILPPYFMVGLMFVDYVERKTGEKLTETTKALFVLGPPLAFISYIIVVMIEKLKR